MEESIVLGDNYSLVAAAAIVKPAHFVAVTKIQGSFYNLDNLDDNHGKKKYSSFKEAVTNREIKVKEEIRLDKRSPECRRAGSVNYLFYVLTESFLIKLILSPWETFMHFETQHSRTNLTTRQESQLSYFLPLTK